MAVALGEWTVLTLGERMALTLGEWMVLTLGEESEDMRLESVRLERSSGFRFQISDLRFHPMIVCFKDCLLQIQLPTPDPIAHSQLPTPTSNYPRPHPITHTYIQSPTLERAAVSL